MHFADRREAGTRLAELLQLHTGHPNQLVLGLPRGGVPVAYEVARALRVPLDLFVVRKLGVPGHEELAMGAVATGGVRVLNDDVLGRISVSEKTIEEVTFREQRELARLERAYRGDRPAPAVQGRLVILVDDGLATGSTMRAAISAVRLQRAGKLVVAVPVASPATCEELRLEVDEIVCAITPEPLYAVGLWYQDFSQTTDDEVRELLRAANERARASQPHAA